jgi:hypothetical protein
MSKQNKIARMETAPSSARGRTAKTRKTTPESPLIANKAAVKLEKRTEASRPTGKSVATRGGKNRGDRRDMSPTYTGNAKHAARGNTPRRDVKTRAR